jgi:tyrosine-protein kinase
MDPQHLRRLAVRWAVVVTAMTLIGAMVAYGIARRAVPVFSAEGRMVVVGPLAGPGSLQDTSSPDTGAAAPPNPITTDPTQVASTVAGLVTEDPLLARVVDELHLDETPARLAARVQAQPVAGSALVSVTVTDSSPARAAAIANALMNDVIAQLTSTASLPSTAALQSEVATAQSEVSRIEGERSASLQRGAGTAALDVQLAQARDRLAQLDTELGMQQSAEQASPVRVVSPAAAPSASAGTSPRLSASLGAFAGLLVGIGIALTLGQLDRSIHTEADIRRLGLAVLGSVPAFRPGARGEEAVLAGEAYRRLRANLLLNAQGAEIRSVVVTAAHAGAGTTRTAANLAAVVASSDQRVLLVDADLRHPTQHRLLRMHLGSGLAELLRQRATGGDASGAAAPAGAPRPERRPARTAASPCGARGTGHADLWLLSAGTAGATSAELMGSRHVQDVLRDLEGRYDLVVVDTPAVGDVADALGLARAASATLLVVESGRTTGDDVRQVAGALETVGASILGVVLNRCPGRETRLRRLAVLRPPLPLGRGAAHRTGWSPLA